MRLGSAVGSSQSVSTGESVGQSGGVALSVGSQTGLVFQGGAYQGGGNDKANSTTHRNTTVTGSKTVSIASGGDTTMRGAVVSGKVTDRARSRCFIPVQIASFLTSGAG